MQEELYQSMKTYENDLIKIYNRPEFVRELALGEWGGIVSAKQKRVTYDMALMVFEPSQNVSAFYIYGMDDRPVGRPHHAYFHLL